MNTYGLTNHLILTARYEPRLSYGTCEPYRIRFYVNPDHAIIEITDAPPSEHTRIYKATPPSSLFDTIFNHIDGVPTEHSEDLYCAIDNWIERSPKAEHSMLPADWLPVRDPALKHRIELEFPDSPAAQ